MNTKKNDFDLLLKNAEIFDIDNFENDLIEITGVLQKSKKPNYFVLSNTRIHELMEIKISDVKEYEVLQDNHQGDIIATISIKSNSIIKKMTTSSADSRYAFYAESTETPNWQTNIKNNNIRPFVLAIPHMAPHWRAIETVANLRG